VSRPLRVFLCHASQDKPAVWKLHRYLKQHGVQPWLDQEDLLPGQNWEVEIPRALFSSDVILVCLSKNSVDKEGYVQKEISFALDKALEKPEGTIFVIPVKLEECDIPKRLGRYQWVDLSRTDGRKRLLLGLNKRASDLGAEVSPVVLGDVRQQKGSQKPDDSDINERSTRAVDRILATAKSIREQKEQEDREKTELGIVNGEEQKSVESAVSTQDEREKKQELLDNTAEEARYLKDMLESINGAQTKEDRPVAVGPVEPERYFPSVHKPAAQPTPRFFAGSQPRKRKLPVWVIGLLAFGLILLSVWGVYQLTIVQAVPTSTPLLTSKPALTIPSSTESLTEMPKVTFTETLAKTPTAIFTETPTELPLGIGSTMIGKDGMTLVYVPAGEFLMGSTIYHPKHLVTIDAFWIDQTEVTNKKYYLCVAAGACKEPINKNSSTRPFYFGNSEFDDYPVIYVNWDMAKAYCNWIGRRLPTEAEWEKAARGPNANPFPWGDKVPNKDLLNFNRNVGDTTTVGYYYSGRSFYGAFDMAGNVWEWVNDWYSWTYYDNSPQLNPPGPDSGQSRVLRGGSWIDISDYVISYVRSYVIPTSSNYDTIGFRCALSP